MNKFLDNVAFAVRALCFGSALFLFSLMLFSMLIDPYGLLALAVILFVVGAVVLGIWSFNRPYKSRY